MKILEKYDLKYLNTFAVSVRAKFFIQIESESELKELFTLPEFQQNKKIFLGSGSNVLFTKDFDGIVVLNKLKGIEILEDNSETVVIKCMSGEVWHDLVNFAVERGYWGIENLSFIPGTVGAAPMQNIGAYGAELKNVLESVESFEITTGKENKKRIFSKEECELGYRDSVFKNKFKDQYFIVSITLKLSKIEKKNISYKILQEYLEKNKIEVKNSKDVSEAVMAIRKSKLPDPNEIGNVGSFFKNIFVGKEKLKELLKIYPTMPHFEEGEGTSPQPSPYKGEGAIKIPSAWLIEQCGWKGKRIGRVGVHDRQALVIVNHGGATGEEIKNLAEQIITSVQDKFSLTLVPEVNIV